MKKYLFIALMLALVLTPVMSQAVTNSSASTMAELQALIVKLQAQIKVLQQQQSQRKVAFCSFSNDLSLGDGEGDGLTTEISALHKVLIAGRFLNISKPTGWYGKLTQSAVKNWQMKNGLPVTGVIGLKDRSVLCGDLVAVPVNPVVYPKEVTSGSVYFSSKFFDYGYTIGDSVSSVYNQQLIVTNGTNSNVNFKISVDNQPSWLNTKYSDSTLTINPGQPLGLGVSVNPVGLSAGNYKTEMKISGDFPGSPKIIPITLRVYGSTTVKPITIGSTFSLWGFEGQYKKYTLYLSGGTAYNPVKSWTLTFSCPSNVPEVMAKVAGNVCTGEPYQLGYENNETGSIEIPLSIIHTDLNIADLKINIEATGKDGSLIGEKDYTLPVHKG